MDQFHHSHRPDPPDPEFHISADSLICASCQALSPETLKPAYMTTSTARLAAAKDVITAERGVNLSSRQHHWKRSPMCNLSPK